MRPRPDFLMDVMLALATGRERRKNPRPVESLGGVGSAARPGRSDGRDARGARGRLHQA